MTFLRALLSEVRAYLLARERANVSDIPPREP